MDFMGHGEIIPLLNDKLLEQSIDHWARKIESELRSPAIDLDRRQQLNARLGPLKQDRRRLIADCQHLLSRPSYTPKPFRQELICDEMGGKERSLLIPSTPEDRTIAGAVRIRLESLCELHPSLHGGRGGYGVGSFVFDYLWHLKQGYGFSLKLDIQSAFSMLDQQRLKNVLNRKIEDGRLVSLVLKFITVQHPGDAGIVTLDRGIPQGSPPSPFLFGLFMSGVMAEFSKKGFLALGYIDDFILLCRTKEETLEARAYFIRLLNLKGFSLNIKKSQTEPVHHSDRQKFLGLEFQNGEMFPGVDNGKRKEDHYTNVLESVKQIARGEGLKIIWLFHDKNSGYSKNRLLRCSRILVNVLSVLKIGAESLGVEIRKISQRKSRRNCNSRKNPKDSLIRVNPNKNTSNGNNLLSALRA
jgi:hypothetical protein